MYMVQNKMTPDDDGSDANASKTLNEKPPDGHLHKEESLGLQKEPPQTPGTDAILTNDDASAQTGSINVTITDSLGDGHIDRPGLCSGLCRRPSLHDREGASRHSPSSARSERLYSLWRRRDGWRR